MRLDYLILGLLAGIFTPFWYFPETLKMALRRINMEYKEMQTESLENVR